MIKNYFKIAWRNLVRNKIYTAINITGLAIGLSVCMLIILYVEHETSYDKFHANADRIFWIQGKIKMGNDSVFMPEMSFPTASLASQNDPSVESYVRYMKPYKKPSIENALKPSLKFAEDKFLFADSNFFSFFSFKLLNGNKNKVLKNPFTVVISSNTAKKYFGENNPIGKTIKYDDKYNFTITGVAEKVPSNSSIQYDFIASIQSLASMDDYKDLVESQRVQLGSFSTYFLLNNKRNVPKLEATLQQLGKNTSNGDNNETYFATPLTSTHLDANFGDNSNIKYLSIFPFIAALILLLALTNYISLSTARSTTRAKEIGVRKVMGASKKSISVQFFIESALYTTISFVLAYVLSTIFQPLFFNFLQINIDPSFLYNSHLLLSFAALFVITVLLASAYPSILLSAYKPVKVLYGKFSKQSGGLTVRKAFTVFQFSISVALIVCAIVIDKQMYFFRHTNTGVNKDNIIMIPFAPSIGKHYSAFRQETASLAGVQQTTVAHYPMYKGYDDFFFKPKNTNMSIAVPVFSVDENFIPMLGLHWKIKPDDSLFYQKQNQVIINEAAISKLNLNRDPLHEKLSMSGQQVEIAGVLKDFNYESLHDKIGALSMFIGSDTSSGWGMFGGCLFAKVNPHVNIPSLIKEMKKIYEKYDDINPFEYSFMDESYNAMYTAEDRLSKIFTVFTSFTIFIACLGLFGLATFMAEQRTKEIGIRKVLGASVSQVTSMLSKDFIKLVVLAVVIASPVAWWAMNKWLRNFVYRINISWWIFFIAGLLVFVIALITIIFKAIKAAIANPVDSLRSE